MDSAEKSSSMKDFIKVNNDNKAKNLKGTSRQREHNDRGENVFTSVSSQTECNIVPQNGPRGRELNSLSINETGQSSKPSENSSDCCKNSSTGSQSQSQICSGGNVEQDDSSNSSNIDSITRNNGVESNQETQTYQKLNKTSVDKVGSNNYNLYTPSTSKGVGKSCDISESSSFNNRKRPSSLTLNKRNLDGDDSSSDTGNDDYSLGSEDGCIYTYRGGEHLADLPSSFFSLDMGLPLEKHLPHPNYAVPQVPVQNARDQGSHASSPDMDFLEMDFDPGPSCEADTGDESTPDADLEAASNMPEENEPVYRAPSSPEYVAGARHNPLPVNIAVGLSSHYYEDHNYYSIPSTSRGIEKAQEDSLEGSRNHQTYGPYITHVNPMGEQFLVRRTMSHWPTSMPTNLHVSSGDLVSPREMLTYDEQHAETTPYTYQINQGERPTVIECMNLFHLTMAKRLLIEKSKSDPENHEAASVTAEASAGACTVATGASVVEVQRSMVWSEIEACERQVTQIGTSACGATAIVNVFNALGVPVNLEQINSSVGTRQRANNAPLPRYLMSRAIAGCTAADLVSGIHRASDGLVTARFFPTHPERAFSLSHWLADWISLGAVPILTLNLQAGCDNDIPDAWHHQMVFGVSPRGIYLCNPIECVRETTLWPRLTSPSVLLVRCRDVLSRWTPTTDLTPLMAVPDRRFYSFNVLGQVVNVIREWRMNGHIRIPASYQTGITIAALTGSEAHRRLMHAAQPPILGPHTDTT